MAKWAFPNVPLLCMKKWPLTRGGQQEIELSESEFVSPKYYFWHWIIESHLLGGKFRAGNNPTSIFNLPHVLGNCGTIISGHSIMSIPNSFKTQLWNTQMVITGDNSIVHAIMGMPDLVVSLNCGPPNTVIFPSERGVSHNWVTQLNRAYP